MAGDALEMATVKRALSGVDVVIQSLGVSAGPEIIFEPTRLFSKATRVLVTAMEEAQIKRLICVTGFGAGDSRGHGGLLYNAAFHLGLGSLIEETRNDPRFSRACARHASLFKVDALASDDVRLSVQAAAQRSPRRQLAADNFSMVLTVRWCRSFADQ